MKPIKSSVIAVTAFLFFYALTPHFGVTYDIVFVLFLIGNGLLFYLVYAVLTKGEAPKEKFDDGFWYSDFDKQYNKDKQD